MSTGAYDAMWDVYPEAIRSHAHQLLAWAYSDLRCQLNATMSEPDITGILAGAMRARLNAPDTPETFDHYCVGDEAPVSPQGEMGTKRPRLDITVTLTGVKPRGVYVFEAKRLRTNGFPIGLYVGADGMGCFIEERYAKECPEAAMVALWQNRSVGYWQGELQRVIEADAEQAEPSLRGIGGLERANVIADLRDEWETAHSRRSGKPIRLFHIFLDCS